MDTDKKEGSIEDLPKNVEGEEPNWMRRRRRKKRIKGRRRKREGRR